MRAAKTAAQATLSVLAVLLVAPALLIAFPALAGADDAEVVLTGSMMPGIRPGDVAFLDDFEYAKTPVAVGDVVAYRATRGDGPPVLHRVVEVVQTDGVTYYVLKGDANDAIDPEPVPRTNLVGTYAFRIPYYGHLVMLAKSKAGILAFIVAPSVLVIVHELRVLARRGKDAPAPPPTPAAPAPPAPPARTTFEVVRR